MNIRKKLYVALAAISLCAFGTTAQNLQSASTYSKMHSDLLAKQNRVKDQIRVQEAQKYAADLYEECEPEPDIYTEGWESNLVNCYKDANVPNTKVLDVRHYVMPIKGNYVTSHYVIVLSSAAPTRVLTCVPLLVIRFIRHSQAVCASLALSVAVTASMSSCVMRTVWRLFTATCHVSS